MDQYDIHIEYLRTLDHSGVIKEWNNWQGIFRSTGYDKPGGSLDAGCLTTVRKNDGFGANAANPDLTARIRADERIPRNENNVKEEHYSIFAEWHRQIDKELGRV